jgi:hypothetical protein
MFGDQMEATTKSIKNILYLILSNTLKLITFGGGVPIMRMCFKT